MNDVGEGPLSNPVSIILGTVPDTPQAPTKVTTTLTSITVSWNAPDSGGSPILSYYVYINSGL